MIKKLAIRFPNWLGDAVMATPIIEGLRTLLPETSLHVVAKPPICTLLEGMPVDSFIPIPSSKSELRSILKSFSFDSGLLLTRSFSSAWDFFRAGIKERIGYKDHFRTPLLTHALSLPEDEEHEHAVLTYQRLLDVLTNTPHPVYEPKLHVSASEIMQAQRMLESHGVLPHHILIGINPGAAYGSAKCWPKENFRVVTENLIQDPRVRVIYFGDKNGKPLVDEICARLSPRVVNFAGKTNLRELMSLISLSKIVVTNDSGPMHLSSALQIPTVALFGSTNAVKTGPWAFGHVVQHKVACSPCYLRTCPIDFRCMTGITPEMVLHAIQESICTSKTH